MKLDIQRLRPVPLVKNGVERLKRDIAECARVFCVCAIGRDYHLGARDAEKMLKDEVENGSLVEVSSELGAEHRLYKPKNPSPPVLRAITAGLLECEEDMRRAEEILAKVPDRGNVKKAFQRLREMTALPVTTGNVRLNEQAMTLIMERCFKDPEDLRVLLDDPECIKEPSEDEAREFQREVELSALYDEKGELERCKRLDVLKPSASARLEFIRNQIDRLERRDSERAEEHLDKIGDLLAKTLSVGKDIKAFLT